MAKKNKNKIEQTKFEDIKSPDFLRSLTNKELENLAKQIREEIIDAVSKNGGHLSSNLGVVESTIALCKVFDFKKDKIIFDVGHQSYAYKILTGRSLKNLRQKDGVSGFQKMSESPYDHFECGHSSTSISVAESFAFARDLKHEKYDVIAFIGDGSFPNGLSMEAVLSNIPEKHKVIIVINNNEMSISPLSGGVNSFFRRLSTSSFYRKSKSYYQRIMSKTKLTRKIYSGTVKIKNFIKRLLVKITFFDNLGYSIIGAIDGHNFKELQKAFIKAKENDKSTIILLKTVKGKGYSFAENDLTGYWHGVAPFNIDTGEPIKEFCPTWSTIYADLMLEEMREHKNAISIAAATSVGSETTFVFDEFLNRSLDVGIAEEHAFTFASGLAVEGYHPIISIYSTFMQRAYDQINHDLSRMNCNATILVDRAGLLGNDGETHQGIYDVGFIYSIPNTVITMASCESEAKQLFDESFSNHGPFFIRYPRTCYKSFDKNNKVIFGKWNIENLGKDKAVITYGPIINELIEVSKEKQITLVNAIYLKPIDEQCLKSLLNYKTIIIYDVYAVENSFASMVKSKLMDLSYKGIVITKAIPDVYVSHASIDEQRKLLELDLEDFIKSL